MESSDTSINDISDLDQQCQLLYHTFNQPGHFLVIKLMLLWLSFCGEQIAALLIVQVPLCYMESKIHTSQVNTTFLIRENLILAIKHQL